MYVSDADSLGGAICASAGCIGREPQLWSPSTACRSLPLFPPESGGPVWPSHRSVFIQIGMLSGRIAPPTRRCDQDSSVALSEPVRVGLAAAGLSHATDGEVSAATFRPLGHASVGRLSHAINRLVHTKRMDESACCSCMLKRKVLRLPRAIGLCVTHVAALKTPSE